MKGSGHKKGSKGSAWGRPKKADKKVGRAQERRANKEELKENKMKFTQLSEQKATSEIQKERETWLEEGQQFNMAGILNEGMPETTWNNPLVVVTDDNGGMDGHYHLSTAQRIHQFIPGLDWSSDRPIPEEALAKLMPLAAAIKKKGENGSVAIMNADGKLRYLALSKWTAKEIEEGGDRDAAYQKDKAERDQAGEGKQIDWLKGRSER